MVAFTKPGIHLIERRYIPIQTASGIARIDVIGTNMIFTIYRLQPGDDAPEEAVVIDRVEFPIGCIADEVQFVLSVLAQVGMRMALKKPLVVQ